LKTKILRGKKQNLIPDWVEIRRLGRREFLFLNTREALHGRASSMLIEGEQSEERVGTTLNE